MNQQRIRQASRRLFQAMLLFSLLVVLSAFALLRSGSPFNPWPERDRGRPVRTLQAAMPVDRLAQLQTIAVPRPLGVDITPDGGTLCLVRNVLSEQDPRGGLTLVDLESGATTTALIPDRPDEQQVFGRTLHVAASPDGQYCFVSVSANVGDSVSGALNRVEVVRIDSGAPVFQDPVILENSVSPFGPLGLAVNGAGSRLYVADRGNGRVQVIDVESGSPTQFQQVDSILTGGQPADVALSPDGSRLYVAARTPARVFCVDTSSNTLGGTACDGRGNIPVSVGPSSSAAYIDMSPDGRMACVVSNEGLPCVSCIDTDPASASFNQEAFTRPTSGDRLDGIAFDPDGERVFVSSRNSGELLAVHLEDGQQQRIAVGSMPSGLVNSGSDLWAVNVADETISVVGPASGPFIKPQPEDGRSGDAFSDTTGRDADCLPLPRDGFPDLGADGRIVLNREGNRIRGFRVGRPDQAVEVVLSDPHPVTGKFQTALVTVPESQIAPANPGLMRRMAGWLGQTLGVSLPLRHRVTIDSYDAQFRPRSFVIETEMGDPADPTIIESRIEGMDADQNGLTDAFMIDALSFFPSLTTNPVPHDTDGDGQTDYVGFGYNASQFQFFLPLGDTDGDGIPDTPAFDFDGDNRPDSDLPLLPFLSGAPNPEVALNLYFAQFGDGEGGGVNIFSQIVLLNLDSSRPASAEVILTGDDGSPLSVDLNGQAVQGQTSVEVPAAGIAILRTDGEGPLASGSVTVQSNRALAGVILFGGTAGLAGVGSSPAFDRGIQAVMESRSTDGIRTGVALKNLEESANRLELSLNDAQGTQLATASEELPPFGHRALFVEEIAWQALPDVELDFSDFTGLLAATSQGRFTATVLQTRPGELATMPVAPDLRELRFGADSMSLASRTSAIPLLDQELSFAQFANGAGFSSQIFLVNLSSQTANARIDLRDKGGAPIDVNLNGQLVQGQTDLQIPAGGLSVLRSDAQGGLVVGSARVSSDAALSGVILFSGASGTAGVGASPLLRNGFQAPMETNLAEGLNTGIAVSNLEASPASLQLRLLSQSGAELATAELDLPANGQDALFVTEIPWQPAQDFSDFQGVLQATLSAKVAATVIQTRPGVFSTQPVVPSLN